MAKGDCHMKTEIISAELVEKFAGYHVSAERSAATTEKYCRDVSAFSLWLNGRLPDRKSVMEYKAVLLGKYRHTSVNSVISSLNSFFGFCGRDDLKIRSVRIQKQIFSDSSRELTKAEYEKLLTVARERGNRRLCLLMQTVCALGIRVSELKYVTVQATERMAAEVHGKGKLRTVLIPKGLCAELKKYAENNGITKGAVFVTRRGKILDRSNIWADMKKLGAAAGIPATKVFPHNLRHLFARTYYSMEKDIVRLADILGHSSVNTTRIYTMESGDVHRHQIQRLGLFVDKSTT